MSTVSSLFSGCPHGKTFFLAISAPFPVAGNLSRTVAPPFSDWVASQRLERGTRRDKRPKHSIRPRRVPELFTGVLLGGGGILLHSPAAFQRAVAQLMCGAWHRLHHNSRRAISAQQTSHIVQTIVTVSDSIHRFRCFEMSTAWESAT